MDTDFKPLNTDNSLNGKDRLLIVAMKLFGEKGYDSVNVRELAAAANVSIGLINHHFGSKQQLREAVDEYFLSRSGKALEKAMQASASLSPNEIDAYQKTWMQRYSDEWPHFVSYFRRALMDGSPWGSTLFKRYYESIRSMIDRRDIAGEVSPEVDRAWLPLLYTFLYLGPIVLDPYIQEILGKSTYDTDMWPRFNRAADSLFKYGSISTKPQQ